MTNKDESNDVHNISDFEEIMDKLFQERSNIDASLVELLEFSQLGCFTYGIVVNSHKIKIN